MVPANVMKLITLFTLLISDADVLFTITSIYSYATYTAPDGTAQPLLIMIILVGMFTFIYIGGCIIAARESYLFVDRFREKVRLNEIAGLDLEEMDLFFSGKRCARGAAEPRDGREGVPRQGNGQCRAVNWRAARDGHVTAAQTNRGERGATMRTRPWGRWWRWRCERARMVKLAPTPAEAKRKYKADKERALYLLCQHKDITFAFFRERRSFARRVVKPSHSIPLVRLMVYGWQPTVSHTDFAGILNANALYSFTIGFPQLGCSIAYITQYEMSSILLLSLAIGTISLVLSVANMVLDFPKQLFDIAQKEGEAHVFALQAEEKSEFWTQKMEVEIQQQQEFLLQQSAVVSSQQDGGAPIQKPLSIIRDVMDLERDCMRARVDYVAHQMFMALHESERRQAIRSGQLENPYAIEADAKHAVEAERAAQLGAQGGPAVITPQQLPAPTPPGSVQAPAPSPSASGTTPAPADGPGFFSRIGSQTSGLNA